MKKGRHYSAISIRLLTYFETVLSNILARMGTPARKFYIANMERQIASELARINKGDINEGHYFDLMSLYPDLKRVFFVHIPKCGGTSIRQNLVESYGVAPIPMPSSGAIQQSIQFMVSAAYRKGILDELTTTNENLQQKNGQRATYLRVLAAFMVATRPRYLFVLGHQRASEIAPLYRDTHDLIFTTVREPVSMLRSLVNYRVSHTLSNQNRPDSIELLNTLRCSFEDFETLVKTEPQTLVTMILSTKKPSLASYLAFNGHTDIDTVWSGIVRKKIYIAHVTEQDAMQAELFGEKPRPLHKNAMDAADGPAGSFSSALRDDWIVPYIDNDSSELYQRLLSRGIIGFWNRGGSRNEYQQLLQNSI